MAYLVPQQKIERRILLVRSKSIILDNDLALLYGVSTKRLNEQVKRNKRRFPKDFMFRLTKYERNELVAFCDRFHNLKHSTSMPLAFTEPGVAMLSSVLNSERAIRVNIEIIRTFIKLRKFISSHKELALKLHQLENKVEKHDEDIQSIFEAIRQLMLPPVKPKRRIGFVID